MSRDQHHAALPRLYGVESSSRARARAEGIARPPDPDDLPIAAYQTDEEQDLCRSIEGRGYVSVPAARIGAGALPTEPEPGPEARTTGQPARPFGLRAIAGRLIGGGS